MSLHFNNLIAKAKAILLRFDETSSANRGELKAIHNQMYLFTPKLPGVEYCKDLGASCKDCVVATMANLRKMIEWYDVAQEQATEKAKESASVKSDKTETKTKTAQ